jgi:hypothetical protein
VLSAAAQACTSARALWKARRGTALCCCHHCCCCCCSICCALLTRRVCRRLRCVSHGRHHRPGERARTGRALHGRRSRAAPGWHSSCCTARCALHGRCRYGHDCERAARTRISADGATERRWLGRCGSAQLAVAPSCSIIASWQPNRALIPHRARNAVSFQRRTPSARAAGRRSPAEPGTATALGASL